MSVRSLFSFMRRLSAPSPIASLPMKSMSLIRTRGPSLMVNVRFTSLGPPAIDVTVCETSPSRCPFSDSISRTTLSTRRICAGSMNESRRITLLISRSFSSTFVASIFSLPMYSTILTR